MSDEGRDYVKRYSPFAGTTFWFHYVMGDLANRQHNYELFIGDRRITEEWPFSKRAVERARAELIEAGFLTVLDPTSAPGKPIRVRFEFPDHPPNARHLGDRPLSNARQSSANARHLGDRTPAKNGSAPITNQRGTEGTEISPPIGETTADPLYGFDHFWTLYPKRHGKRVGKRISQGHWARLTLEDKRAAYRGTRYYREACDGGLTIAKDPERFLRHRVWEDWQEPAQADRAAAPRDPMRRGGSLRETVQRAAQAEAERKARAQQPTLAAAGAAAMTNGSRP